MFWIVTRDVLEETANGPWTSEVGLKRGTEPDGELENYRLLDDDRELYYVVRADEDGIEDAFDYFMGASGVTIVQRRENGCWTDYMS